MTTASPQARTAIALIVTMMAGACVPDGGAIRLASIDQVESREIVAGEEFKIFGDGFVPGSVDLVLDGEWLAAGRDPHHLELGFSGNAVTEREISTVLPVETFRELGVQHALFEGQLRARFKTSEKVRADWIEAVRARMVLDILSSEPDGGRDTSLLEKQSRRFLSRMGVAGRSDPQGGFIVEGVGSGGAAALAGLRAGDIILVARGLRVYSDLDLLPPSTAARTTWVVARTMAGNDGGRVSLEQIVARVPREASGGTPDPVWFAAAAATIVLIAIQGEFLGLLLLPLARARRRIAGLIARLRRQERDVVSIEDEPPGWEDPPSRWMQNILATPVVIVTASACVALLYTAAASIHIAAVYVALVGLAWLTGIQSSRGTPQAGALARRILACLAAPAPVAIVLVWRGLFAPAMSLDAAADGQAMEPWTWHGLRDPFAAIMLLVALHTTLLPERRDIRLGRHLAHQAYSVATCTVIAHVMLGGSAISIPVVDPGSMKATGLRLAFLLAKVLALYLLLQARSRDRSLRANVDPAVLAGLAIVLVASLVASVTAGPILGSWIPQLPQITTAVFGALMFIYAAGAGRSFSTCSVRVQPW